jgi:hypothetical protein
MRVRSDLAGCICVLYLTDGQDPSYITATRDVRRPGYSFIEVVVRGQVRHRLEVPDEGAPARIMGIARTWVQMKGYVGCRAVWRAEQALFEGVTP